MRARWYTVVLCVSALLVPIAPVTAQPPGKDVQVRLTEGQQILDAIGGMYAGLQDVTYEFDEWAEIEGSTRGSSSGKVIVRLDDGAVLLDVRTVHAEGFLSHETRSLFGQETRAYRKVAGRQSFHVQPRQVVGLFGYALALVPLVASRNPDRYVPELIGWERVGLKRCARLALYESEVLRPVLARYLEAARRGHVAESPPGYHFWFTLDDNGMRMRQFAFVARYGAPNAPNGRVGLHGKVLKDHAVVWKEGQPPLWIPTEIMVELQWPRPGGAAAFSVRHRRVVVPESIRVNTGVGDDTFLIKPPAGVKTTRPGPPLKGERIRGVLAAQPMGGFAIPVEPEAVEQSDLKELLSEASRRTTRTTVWSKSWPWLVSLAGVALLAIALWLRIRRA